MPCEILAGWSGRPSGVICFANPPIRLMKGVWMEWHNYFGPTFYTDKECTKEHADWWERPGLVRAFNEWLKANHPTAPLTPEP